MSTISRPTVREFQPTDADYAAYVEVGNTSYPEYRWTVEESRHDDSTWDHSRFWKVRLLSEGDGRVVGAMDLSHNRWAFQPDKYRFDLAVLPDSRRRGHGSSLYQQALELLRERGARAMQASAKESMSDGVEFLVHRGFAEVKRDWESRLDVNAFDESHFSGARERAAAEGVTITTLATELARDPGALRAVHEMNEAVQVDVPSIDPPTPTDFETFEKHVMAPNRLHEAFFLAVRDGRYVGVSNLWRSLDDPTFLWQGLTGVVREERGKGIAMALKLETVRFAREQGYREIKTWNDQRNRPMLGINEAMGFAKQPAWISYEKHLTA